MQQNLGSLFLNSLAKWPDHAALWVKGDSFTYQELWESAAKVSLLLQSQKNQDLGTHVAVFSHKSASAYVGVIASLVSGFNYVPLNPRFPAERNFKMVTATEAKVWIVDSRCLDEAKTLLEQSVESILVILPELESALGLSSAYPQHHFYYKEDLNKFDPQAWKEPNLSTKNGAYTLFTSGSTGIPKGVLVTHENVLSYLKNIHDLVQVSPGDRCTHLFDLTFDLSVHDMFVCWQGGGCLYVIPENAALFTGRFVQEHELTHWFSVPSTGAVLKQMDMLESNAFPSLKSVLFCGEALSCPLARSFQQAAPNAILINLYGPTEATIAFTNYIWSEADQQNMTEGTVPIGKPFKTQFVSIINDALQPVPGEMGELCLGGDQVMPGYYKDSSLTAEKIISLPDDTGAERRFYRTGDLVSWDEKLGLIFHGRVDRQVKIRGYRVELQEIENALRKILEIEHIAVIPVPVDVKDGYTGVVAYIANTTLKIDMSEVIELSRNYLPDYMVPQEIHLLKEFPLNSNGKVDYKAIAHCTSGI
jgi:D-alanine--poly(phosphoribitol) ligase subunit 1